MQSFKKWYETFLRSCCKKYAHHTKNQPKKKKIHERIFLLKLIIRLLSLKLHLVVKLHFWSFREYGYPFVAITPRSTLTLSGNTSECPSFQSSRSVWKLFVFKRYTWYHITVCKLFVIDEKTWYSITVS